MYWLLPLVALSAASPTVDVVTLDGQVHHGSLVEMTPAKVVVTEAGQAHEVASGTLLEIRQPSAQSQPPGKLECRLVDGSQLAIEGYKVKGTNALLSHKLLGDLTLPRSAIASVRLAAVDPKLEDSFQELLARQSRSDLLIVRKGDVLDHFDGVVGELSETGAKFLLDGDELTVKRERIFGIVYGRPAAAKTPAIAAAVELTTGERLGGRRVSLVENQFVIDLALEGTVKVPLSAVRSIDFSAGKVQYLSAIEPRSVQYTGYWSGPVPPAEFSYPYQRDRELFGNQPLRLSGQTYARGLALHSRTQLVYRLGGEYSKLLAVAGVDETVTTGGRLSLEIKGDGRSLLKRDFAPGEASLPLDVDMTGVVEVELTVDFGSDDIDIGDRLYLANARVIKSGGPAR